MQRRPLPTMPTSSAPLECPPSRRNQSRPATIRTLPNGPRASAVRPHDAAKQKLERLIAHKNDEQCQRTTRSCSQLGRLRLFGTGTCSCSCPMPILDVLHVSRRRPTVMVVGQHRTPYRLAIRCCESCTRGNDSPRRLRISSSALLFLPPWNATIKGGSLAGLMQSLAGAPSSVRHGADHDCQKFNSTSRPRKR